MTPANFPLSLPKAEGPVFTLDQAALERGIAASRESPRRRIIMPVHRSGTEGVQRMLNFMQRGSYARPHCHPNPENIETAIPLRGVFGFVVFHADGQIHSAHLLEAGNPGSCLIDIEPYLWHTVVPLAEDSVLLEIKRGPYNAATDKQFAEWAPQEGAPEAPEFLRSLEAIFDRS